MTIVGASAFLILAVNAVVHHFYAVAWLVGVDAAVTLWSYGALLAGVVSGVAVLAAPRRGGLVRAVARRPGRTAPRTVRITWHLRRLATRSTPVAKRLALIVAVLAGPALDEVLFAVLVPLGLQWWLGNSLVMASVLLVSWATVRAGARHSVVTRPLGAFLASYCLTLVIRLLQPDDNRNPTMDLAVAVLLAFAALGLHGGGLAWARQHGIRIMLGRESDLPRDLPGFLDDAENCCLLRRRGRGLRIPA
ncbi:hypothetical protein [Winogradskya humida]|uniref:hypothetical protein n=1 Tax=Winogradskya humida TaxID=113566 RepID=UPI00194243A7|nr:hypothetical protein [Actinoplanes humidus]